MDYGRREQPREQPRSQPPVSGGAPSGGQGSPDPHSAPQVPSWRPPSWEDFRRMQPAPGQGWGWGRPSWGYGPSWGGRHDDYRSDPHYRRGFEDWWHNSKLAMRSGYGSSIPSWAHDVYRHRMGMGGGHGRSDREWGGRWGGYEGSPRERAWWAGHGYGPWGGWGGPMWGGRGGGYQMGYRDAMREFRDRKDRRHRRRHGHDRRDDRRERDRGGRGQYGYGPRNDNYASPWAFWRRMMWGY